MKNLSAANLIKALISGDLTPSAFSRIHFHPEEPFYALAQAIKELFKEDLPLTAEQIWLKTKSRELPVQYMTLANASESLVTAQKQPKTFNVTQITSEQKESKKRALEEVLEKKEEEG